MIRRSTRQLFRYGLVGLTSNAIAYGAYLLIASFDVSPTVSMTLVYVCAAAVGFVGNRSLTFAHNGSVLTAGFRYIIAHSLGYALNLTILLIFVDRLGYAHQLVQAFAILVVAACLFLAFKFFVFKNDDLVLPDDR